MKNAKEYRQLLQAVMAMKVAMNEKEGPYHVSKWTDEEVVAALNEGYVAGLKEAARVIRESDFLTE